MTLDLWRPGQQGNSGLSPTGQRVIGERLTYLSPAKIEALERAARLVQRQRVRGDFVEAGIALGGSAIVLVDQMRRRRRFHGYDVFGMIPAPSPADPSPVHERYRAIVEGRSEGIGGDVYYGYLDNLYERVCQNLARHGHPVDGKKVQLHRGLFEEILRPPGRVALAHVDCDWYEPVRLCIERVWPRLSQGGLMIFDDYNDYGGCTRAVDEFVAVEPNAILRTRVPSAVVRKE